MLPTRRRIYALAFASLTLGAICCPTRSEASVEQAGGTPCCNASWCIGQETLCTDTCMKKYKRGSEKWKACNQYCSKTLTRCTACCRTHKEPNCHVYCFE